MPRKKTKYLLPFATLTQTDTKSFTEEAKRAAIFSLAELDRAKGGGIIVKKPPEKLVFITQVNYPFWTVPFEELTLLFDGLSLVSHALSSPLIPNNKVFVDNMIARSKTYEAYHSFLKDNLNYFQTSENEEERIIAGLVTDPELLHDFKSYLSEAIPSSTPIVDSVLISPTHNKSQISSIATDLQNSRQKLNLEITSLNETIKLLSDKKQEFIEELRQEIKKTERKFEKEIGKIKKFIAKRTEEINKEYSKQVTNKSKRFEKEILFSQKELIKIETSKEQLITEIENCEARIRAFTIEKDEFSVQKWKERRNSLKKELSETKSTRIKELEEIISNLKEKKKLMIFKLKSEYDIKIMEVTKNLLEVEASRDAEKKIHKERMEKLEDSTSNIMERIDNLAKTIEINVAQYEKIGFNQRTKNTSLVYMPFYLVCYQCKSKKRYTHFPPSLVSNLGLSTKLKGAMGKTRIRELFQPRSKKIVSFLNRFIILMNENVVFNREVNEACSKANMLKVKNFTQLIGKGLEELRDQGWLTEAKQDKIMGILSDEE